MIGAAAYGDVVVFDEAEGGVAQGGFDGAEVGAEVELSILLGEACVGVEHAALPVLHGDDGERGAKVFGRDDVAGELAEGEAVADGERHVVDVGFAAGIGDGALDGEAAYGVGAV